jgi:hypothetical protein
MSWVADQDTTEPNPLATSITPSLQWQVAENEHVLPLGESTADLDEVAEAAAKTYPNPFAIDHPCDSIGKDTPESKEEGWY